MMNLHGQKADLEMIFVRNLFRRDFFKMNKVEMIGSQPNFPFSERSMCFFSFEYLMFFHSLNVQTFSVILPYNFRIYGIKKTRLSTCFKFDFKKKLSCHNSLHRCLNRVRINSVFLHQFGRCCRFSESIVYRHKFLNGWSFSRQHSGNRFA